MAQYSGLSDFEASILERSRRASDADLQAYQPDMPAGERIRTLRKAAGFTLEALAAKAGITNGSLGFIEKGERPVGLVVLKKISKALKVSLVVLVE